MRRYTVSVIEMSRKDVVVIADSEENAKAKAEEMWSRGEILIGDRDFDGAEFRIKNRTKNGGTKK